jgi:hypothetical protein
VVLFALLETEDQIIDGVSLILRRQGRPLAMQIVSVLFLLLSECAPMSSAGAKFG